MVPPNPERLVPSANQRSRLLMGRARCAKGSRVHGDQSNNRGRENTAPNVVR